jgi:hypothetical protein
LALRVEKKGACGKERKRAETGGCTIDPTDWDPVASLDIHGILAYLKW